eukprot:6184598-Pleurochrysis_carterae.AAC.2
MRSFGWKRCKMRHPNASVPRIIMRTPVLARCRHDGRSPPICPGKLTFLKGEKRKTIKIKIIDDDEEEPDEFFEVALSTPVEVRACLIESLLPHALLNAHALAHAHALASAHASHPRMLLARS